MAEKKNKDHRVTINGIEYWKLQRKIGMKRNKRGQWIPDHKIFYGKTKREALQKYENFMKKRSGSLNADTCFGEFVDWYEKNIYMNDSSITDGTKTLHLNSFHNIFDAEGILGRPLGEITGADLQAVLSASSKAPSTKRQCKSFLSRFFKYTEAQHITADITRALVLPKVEHKKSGQEVELFTDEELRTFIDSTPSEHRLRLLVVLAIFTGARISELTALTYDDLKDGQMRINKALKEIDPIKGSGEKARAEVTETKTQSSIRTIPLEPIDLIQREIDNHRRWHQAEMMKYGYRTNYVFTTASGNLYFKSSIRTAFKRLCKALDIEPRGFHTFRHTFGTRLAKSGEPISTVSKLMGHDSISVTSKYYIGIDEAQKRDAVKRLAIL